MYACLIDGKVCKGQEASISVMDHGLLYGDGVFEGLRFYAKRIFRLDQHLERLQNSATAIGLELPMSTIDVTKALEKAIEESNLKDGYIRLVITRGVGALGINPLTCHDAKTIIIVDKLQIVSETAMRNGAQLLIASTRRLGVDQLDPRIKSLNYLNQIMAKREALAAGMDEAIMLNQRGYVAEGSADNIFIVKNGALWTPSSLDGALEGITRGVIFELAKNLGIECHEASLTPYDLVTAEECFLTGTGAEMIPVASIDGTKLPFQLEIFNRLQKAFVILTRA